MRRLIRRALRRARQALRPDETAMADLSATLDPEWYLREYPDVAATGLSPARHFVRHGAASERRPNRFFDPDWYRGSYPDVGTMSPILHYARIGRAELRDPGPVFGVKDYLAAYPDVARTGMDPVEHYIRYGRREGRPLFRAKGGAARSRAGFDPASERGAKPDPDALFVPNETLLRIRDTFARRGSSVSD